MHFTYVTLLNQTIILQLTFRKSFDQNSSVQPFLCGIRNLPHRIYISFWVTNLDSNGGFCIVKKSDRPQNREVKLLRVKSID